MELLSKLKNIALISMIAQIPFFVFLGETTANQSPFPCRAERDNDDLTLRIWHLLDPEQGDLLQVSLCNFGKDSVEIFPWLFPQDYFLKLTIFDEQTVEQKFTGPEVQIYPRERTPLLPGFCFRNRYRFEDLFSLKSKKYLVRAEFFDNLLASDKRNFKVFSNVIEFHSCQKRKKPKQENSIATMKFLYYLGINKIEPEVIMFHEIFNNLFHNYKIKSSGC